MNHHTPPRATKHIILTLILIAVVCTITATTVIASNADDNEDNTWEQPENKHNLSAEEYHFLWSYLENPLENENNSEILDEIGNEEELLYKTSKITDHAHPYQAPTHPETWNTKDIEEHTLNTNEHTSKHPAHADTSSNGVIQDAHINIATVTPSTTLHSTSGTDPVLHAPKNTTIYTLADYRIETPSTITNDTHEITSTLDTHEISETKLTVDTDTHDTTQEDTHTSRLHAQDLEPGENTLRVEATIEAQITETTNLIEEENDTTTYTEIDTYTYTDTHTVSDKITVHVEEPELDVTYREMSDGSIKAELTPNGYWTSIKTPDGNIINNVFDTYTQRNPDWDTFTETTRHSSITETQNTVTPVEVHAFPHSTSPEFHNKQPRYIHGTIDTRGSAVTAPSLPETISFDVASGNYQYTSANTITLETNGYDIDDDTPHKYTINGITADTEHVTEANKLPDPDPSEVTIDLIEHNENTNEAIAEITVTDSTTGNPISTQDSREEIQVSATGTEYNETANTNEQGTTTVVLPNASDVRMIHAEYKPVPTLDEQHAYEPSQQQLTLHSDLMTIHGMYQFIQPVFPLLFILLVLYYSLHVFMPKRIPWPPTNPLKRK